MERKTETFAACVVAVGVLLLWGYLKGPSVSGHVAVGLLLLCPYAAMTVARNGIKVGGGNVLLALGTTVTIGLFTSRFTAPIPGTLVSAESAVAAALGALLIVCWGLNRLRRPTPRWSLAVGLTYLISGALFVFLDLSLNYGPK